MPPAISDGRARLLVGQRGRRISLVSGGATLLSGEIQTYAYQDRRQEDPVRPVDAHMCRGGCYEVEDSTGQASAADGLASHNQVALHEPEHRGPRRIQIGPMNDHKVERTCGVSACPNSRRFI